MRLMSETRAAVSCGRAIMDETRQSYRQLGSGRKGPVGRCLGPSAVAAVSAFLGLAAIVSPSSAVAQSMPGLVVTTTPAPSASPPPPQLRPTVAPPAEVKAAEPAPAAKPKPKPSPAPRKEASAAASKVTDAGGSQTIVAIVNDEPITAYEVEQRSRFLALTVDISERAKGNMKAFATDPKINDRLKAILEETIKANPGKSRDQVIAAFEERKKAFVMSLQQQAVASARSSFLPGLKKKALEELIEERIKLQEAKKQNTLASDDEVNKAFKGLADRNKMTPEQFMAHIKSQGADAEVIKARFKASFSWREVVRRRFGHQISVSSKEIDRIASQAGGENAVELRLQKITIASGGTADQSGLAQRYAEAEAMRRRFSGCQTTQSLTKGSSNAKFEDLGFKSASALPEPTRTLLMAANNGEMVPAAPTAQGMELYAVCDRRTARLDDAKREAAENELQMKEFERLAQRHMNDLRKDSLVEIR